MPADIEVDVASGRRCHRCGESLMLVARVPHTLTRADGCRIGGTRGIGLCGGCDHDDPATQGLLAHFAVNPTVTDETVATVAALVAEWTGRVTHRASAREQDVTDEITDEIDAYLRDEDVP